jgi:hypothetical protein
MPDKRDLYQKPTVTIVQFIPAESVLAPCHDGTPTSGRYETFFACQTGGGVASPCLSDT